jgi:hypothetical protein
VQIQANISCSKNVTGASYSPNSNGSAWSKITLARVKAILIQLLSTSDDATNGTPASSVTINNTATNSLSAQTHSGWFDNGAEGTTAGSKFTLHNGAALLYLDPGAAGITVDATHKIINVVNNDSANPAAVQITVWGADV